MQNKRIKFILEMSLQDIIKTDNIIKVSPHDNLSSALSKLRTSHDSAFLFDEQDKFLGLINPYYCLIKSSYPGNAKVEHCLYHPPKIYIDYPLEKTANHFIQSKVHYLPVFDRQEQFTGIVSARHLLSQFKSLPMFKITINEVLKGKNQTLSVILEDDIVGRAINLFKLTKHSKLVVVNKNGKLKGILSYYDLISYLVSPKKTERRGEREGIKTNFYHHKVKNFAKSFVLTLNPENTLEQVIHLILEKKIGSVVIVDQKRHPIGIITTRDLLRFFIMQGNDNLIKQSRQMFGGFFKHFSSVMTPVNTAFRMLKWQD